MQKSLSAGSEEEEISLPTSDLQFMKDIHPNLYYLLIPEAQV
jgi:hypothetical protein